MRIQRVICEKCLEQQLAQTERLGNISWHNYPKEGNGGADPKGHFRLVIWPPSLPSPPFPGILGEQAAPLSSLGLAWTATRVSVGTRSLEPGAPLLHTPDLSAASVFLARARRLFLLRSADTLGWLGCLCAVATAAPLEGVWGPSILKEQLRRGEKEGTPCTFRVGIWWAPCCFPGSNQPPVCFPTER